MLRVLSILAFVLLGVLMTLDLRKEAGGKLGWKSWLRGVRGSAGTLWGTRRSLSGGNTLRVLRGLLYLLAMTLFLILALTGFLPVIIVGQHLSGALLVVHVTAAPIFALSLALLALLWAHRQRFTAEEWQTMRDLVQRKSVQRDRTLDLLRKVCFWLVLVASLPLILSIIAGVFPLFGTEGQEALVAWHGFSALLLTVAAVVHTYTLTTHSQRRPYYHGEQSR